MALDDISKVLKEKDDYQRILQPPKLLFENKREITVFPEKNLRESIVISNSVQEIKKRILQDNTRQ